MHAATVLSLLTLLAPSLISAKPVPKNATTTPPAYPPTYPTTRPVEKKPWHLHNLTIFTASDPYMNASYITFTFTDKNKGLELTTTCTRRIEALPMPYPYAPPMNYTTTPPAYPPMNYTTTPTNATEPSPYSNSTEPAPSPQSAVVVGKRVDPLADPSTWYPCANEAVKFQYAGVGKPMQVQRSYVDPAVGEAPRDVVTAFGMSGKAVGKKGKVVKEVSGVMRTIKKMEVVVKQVIA